MGAHNTSTTNRIYVSKYEVSYQSEVLDFTYIVILQKKLILRKYIVAFKEKETKHSLRSIQTLNQSQNFKSISI